MFKEMKTYAHLKPGQRGTLRLVEIYGEKLLCVRYRYDEIRGVKLKTVEIVVDEKPLRHPRFNDDDMVPIGALAWGTYLLYCFKAILLLHFRPCLDNLDSTSPACYSTSLCAVSSAPPSFWMMKTETGVGMGDVLALLL